MQVIGASWTRFSSKCVSHGENILFFREKKNSSKSFFFTKVASSLCTPYERPQWRSILQRPIGRRAKICVASIVNNNNTITNNSVSNDYIWPLYEKKEVCIASASEILYSFSTNMAIFLGKYYQIYWCCFLHDAKSTYSLNVYKYWQVFHLYSDFTQHFQHYINRG